MTQIKLKDNSQNPASSPAQTSRFNLLISLALFLLALMPRLLDLGRFLTADEFLWVDRSRNFLAGLTNPAYQCPTRVETWEFAQGLACTLRTGHPGVTTMWTGTFGLLLRWLQDGRPSSLHDYVVAVSTNPLDASFIAPARLGDVLIMSLGVVLFYWLVRRLFGGPVALISAVLLALNPFHIAYSRVIHHDALSTTFMVLSVLTAFIYWGERQGKGWLILSGFLAGFAFLSKLSSLFLMPFIALIGLRFFGEKVQKKESNRRSTSPVPFLFHTPFYSLLGRTILDGLLWFAAAVAVWFIFWPAMWVAPVETLQIVFSLAFQYSTGPHAKGVFFLGESLADPGPLFYPVTWLYHTSPLVMVGLVAALAAWLLGQRGRQRPAQATTENQDSNQPQKNSSSFNRYLPLILLFILGYYLLMTTGEKKQDRYFLPIYPWVDLIAAVGLIWIANFLFSRFLPPGGRSPHQAAAQRRAYYPLALLLTLILLLNGLLVVFSYPYYFTYYNPLLGGLKGAANVLTIGWGEGLDLAAGYLNQKANSPYPRVASWYESTFAPFYRGPSISYSKEKGKALAGDYVIFYINQTQRRFPDDVLFDYFENRFEPEAIITLKGLDYAWIYPSLGVDHYIQDQTYTGIAALLAWQWLEGDGPLTPGRPAEFELYWEYLGKQPEEAFFFRLVDLQDRSWAEGRSQPVPTENPPLEQWRDGEIIVERGTLTPPPDMPPGQYRLQIGFYTDAPAVTAGELLFVVPDEEALVTVGQAGPLAGYRLPPTATPIDHPLGRTLTLLGATWPAEPVSQEADLPLDLYWRVEQPLPADAILHLGLMDEAGEAGQAWFNLTLAETFNPARTTWQPGAIIHTRWRFDLLPEVEPGRYHFELVLPEDIETGLSFGRLIIAGEAP